MAAAAGVFITMMLVPVSNTALVKLVLTLLPATEMPSRLDCQ